MDLTVSQVFSAQSDALKLNWYIGKKNDIFANRTIPHISPASLIANHLNLIRPHPIQIIGESEAEYLDGLGKNTLNDTIKQLFNYKPVLIIYTRNSKPSDNIMRAAKKHNTNIFLTSLSSADTIERLQYYFAEVYAQNTLVHGVFIEVFGIGTLLSGPSGIGKSELALELVTRGHRLVADDAVEFFAPNPDTVMGKCPELLKDFTEVRGLGIINIRQIFGDSAIAPESRLGLIIQLQSYSDVASNPDFRLDGAQRNRKILTNYIPEVILPVAVGRSLAVIVEAAVRNHVLKLRGYDAMQDFIQKQQEQITRKS